MFLYGNHQTKQHWRVYCGFSKHIQEILEQIRATVKEAAPAAEETIKYQMPTFMLNGNLVHFAAFKNHIGFYPAPVENVDFKQELSIYKKRILQRFI